MTAGFSDEVHPTVSDRLFERRIIVVSGLLDDAACSELVAKLLTLDALGDEAISFRLTSQGGSPDGCLGVVDVIDALGVPVRATALGRVEGASLAVFVAAEHRSCGRHATFVLHEEESSFAGPARMLQNFAAEQTRRRQAIAEVIARRSPLDADRIASDMTSRLILSAPEAIAYGLVDEIFDMDRSLIQFPGATGGNLGFRPHPSSHD